ncbi:MAG: DivIVA domain-containing protein [Acidimicrobiia bacterium]|nr:DivIVA domain-containing protein [Acidimicrobiia bacterium]
MADSLSPDEIAHRTFQQRLRGYDPREVEAFLEEVAASTRELTARYDAVHTRLLELGNRDLTAEFDLISQEVGRILQDAREAAEGMRRRAAADAEVLQEEAQNTAVKLRTDAWMAGEKLLHDSTREAEAIVAKAERESLAIIGEAEREAHRRQSTVRRESEETLRMARIEAERVAMDARARSDELILDAGRKVEAAESRAAATEKRRTEMLVELENARQTIGRLESEIEKRREALSGPTPEEVESSTVRLLTTGGREPAGSADSAKGGAWAEGQEVVKIVRPPKRLVDPPSEPVDADAMAAEVARLRSPADFFEPPIVVVPPPEPAEAAPPAAEPPETEEPAPSGEAPAPLEARPGSAVSPPRTEIDDLFARLRHAAQEVPPAVPTAVVPVAQEPSGVGSIESAPPVTALVEPGNPFDLRDRLLLPVTNRVLRAVKRELTEAQNIALEELRVEAGGWEPNAALLADRLFEPFGELLRDGYRAGWVAAAETTNTELAGEGDQQADPGEWAGRFSEALTGAVSEALSDSLRDNHGPRQLAAGLSRVYRSWRTDEAERRVRDIAAGAYHRGLLDGFRSAGLSAARWKTAGRGCTTCREAAEAGPVALGSVFEDAVTEPPAHHDCGCTLMPA